LRRRRMQKRRPTAIAAKRITPSGIPIAMPMMRPVCNFPPVEAGAVAAGSKVVARCEVLLGNAAGVVVELNIVVVVDEELVVERLEITRYIMSNN
jgi:hypothetical protein